MKYLNILCIMVFVSNVFMQLILQDYSEMLAWLLVFFYFILFIKEEVKNDY